MNRKKICYIVGARPQFIKHAPLSRELKKNFDELLIHTGQHYDRNMSKVFFEDLNISRPDYNLDVGSSTHGVQTGNMLIKIEEVLIKERPDIVIVYGDTNSTLAGALTAKKLQILIAHIEAGLRSYNQKMPEEVNRILTDHMSDILFCPSRTSVDNLFKEGIKQNVYNSGDIMYDAISFNLKIAEQKSSIFEELKVEPYSYFLATVHRAENTDNIARLREIVLAFNESDHNIVFCVHPRTKKIIDYNNIQLGKKVFLTEPVGYLDMLVLQKKALKVLTDSGGIQKEAFFLKVPCITLRDETEWVETVEAGANIIVGAKSNRILDAIYNFRASIHSSKLNCYGNGHASEIIAQILSNYLI